MSLFLTFQNCLSITKCYEPIFNKFKLDTTPVSQPTLAVKLEIHRPGPYSPLNIKLASREYWA